MPDDLVTQWIAQLADGDEAAAERIWSGYFDRLLRVARDKLRSSRRRAADEEDVVLSAFNSFYRGLRAGRFPQLDDRRDLWKLLVTLTARKAVNQLRREHTQKRGEGRVRGESALHVASTSQDDLGGIGAVLGREPSPEFAVQMADECEALLDRLDDDRLRRTALLKLEGYTTAEIARALDCAESTVDRRLARIRRKWGEGTEG